MKKTNFTSLIKAIILPLAATCVLGLSSCTSTTKAGDVDADRSQLMLISSEQMEQSSKESYAAVIEEAENAGTLNTDATTTARVRAIAQRLIEQTGSFRDDAPSWDWQVNVIKDNTVNAWCMPGGRIVVYTGIIETLDLNDAQLAAVMGHEIAHALREHSREQASQDALRKLGVSTVAEAMGMGDLGINMLDVASQYTVSLPFSRSHETEADEIGTELMARAGYDPTEAVNIWKKMASLSSNSIPEIMSTHPSNESRIKNLQTISEKVYYLYEEAQ